MTPGRERLPRTHGGCKDNIVIERNPISPSIPSGSPVRAHTRDRWPTPGDTPPRHRGSAPPDRPRSRGCSIPWPSPGKARVWNNLGYAYDQAGRIRDAEAAYLQALAIDPGYALARGNLKGLRARSDSVR